MLVAVRHASTKYNGAKERFRGQADLPLDKHGKEQSISVGEKLKKLNLPIDHYETSPIKRAVQTSDAIGHELGVNFKKNDNLKDWDIGHFSGKLVKPNLAEIHHYVTNPKLKVPGGEAFQDFLDRAEPHIKDMVESDDNHMAVTHNRLTTLIHALAANKGKSPKLSLLKKKGPIDPTGIMMINPDWSTDIIHKGGDES